MTKEEIITEYNKLGSIKATATSLGISHGVVRKALIDAGMLETPLIRRISELRASGLSRNDIALALNISVSWVDANTPYVRNTYLDTEKSANAVRIRKWREKQGKGAQK